MKNNLNEFGLTELQTRFIRSLPLDLYWTGINSTLWVDILCETLVAENIMQPMTVGAMITTLREKGLVDVGIANREGSSGREKKAKYFAFTELGQPIAAMILGQTEISFPAPSSTEEQPQPKKRGRPRKEKEDTV